MGWIKRLAPLLGLCVLGLTTAAFAQERGRTDGPEGSEYGKGGYERPSGGRFSLGIDWGAALAANSDGPPLFVGLTGGYWVDEWFVLEGKVDYLLNNQNLNLMVGPKFRTPFYPVSGYLGLKAGAIVLGNGGQLRFGLSPEAGLEVLVAGKVMAGLGYSPDLALGSGGSSLTHRIFMNMGYRF